MRPTAEEIERVRAWDAEQRKIEQDRAARDREEREAQQITKFAERVVGRTITSATGRVDVLGDWDEMALTLSDGAVLHIYPDIGDGPKLDINIKGDA